jgi:small subunit ribosomal protein S21
MLVIKVKENESIERALKRFKNKFQNTQVLKQLRGRKQYVKPSVARIKELIKAKYIQGLREEEA